MCCDISVYFHLVILLFMYCPRVTFLLLHGNSAVSRYYHHKTKKRKSTELVYSMTSELQYVTMFLVCLDTRYALELR